MSSTARGGQRSEADFYATPGWTVHALLKHLSIDLPGGLWLESSAGDGAIIKAVNAVRKDVTWEVCELREECRSSLLSCDRVLKETSHIGVSFFDLPTPHKYMHQVSINNVPFSMAMEFIEHSLKFAPIVIHLLRLNFLGTAERNPFFRSRMPDVYVVPDRISFTADGKADSIEYMWAVWRPERRSAGKIEVLDATPLEVRRPGRSHALLG